jgi:hypothetical protein
MEIPRRAHVNRWTDTEHAIAEARRQVELLPADVRLTDAVVLLGAAFDSVADYVDGIHRRRAVDVGDATCKHGTAMDVHCCGCHSGFLFDIANCLCLHPAPAQETER